MLISASELKASEKRLKLEQAKRTEKEKERLAKEKAINDRRREREVEREREQQRIRMEAEARREQELARIEALTELNHGIYYQSMLQAIPMDERLIRSKGIRRADDKISLPPSVGAQLLSMDTVKNGPMYFELNTPGGATTHAGLLDFNAPEGTIAIPSKVSHCLYGPPSAPGCSPQVLGPLTVTYKKLDKGSFVKFQPLQRGFHEAVDLASRHDSSASEGGVLGAGGGGVGMREVLEGALMKLTCLSQGDIVSVLIPTPSHLIPTDLPASSTGGGSGGGGGEGGGPMEIDSVAVGEGEAKGLGPSESQPSESQVLPSKGVLYRLIVQELQPSEGVSLIDTDMEAQVVPSLEAEEALRRIEAEREAMEGARRAREVEALEALQAEREARMAKEEREAARRVELSSWLPNEPSESSPTTAESSSSRDTSSSNGSVHEVLFRLPNGSRLSRRFQSSHPAWLLFLFLDSLGAGGLAPQSYRLVMNYPRRVIEPSPYYDKALISALHERGGGLGGGLEGSIGWVVGGQEVGGGSKAEVMVLEPIGNL